MSWCRLCENTKFVMSYGRGGVKFAVRCPDCQKAPPAAALVPATRHQTGNHDVDVVADYLMVYALGEKKAIPRVALAKELRLTLGVDAERALRDIVSTANLLGVPLGAGNAGYFYCQTRADMDDMLDRLTHQIVQMQRRVLKLEEIQATLPGEC